MKIVLSLFDYTTNMVQPWARTNHTCFCVDIQHPKGTIKKEKNIYTVGADIMDYFPPREQVKIVFAFPPCTHLAVSGARHFKHKGLKSLINSLSLFNRAVELAEYIAAPYMIENPVSTVSTYYRKPDYIFQPWQYGDYYTKKTCLWVGNEFVMPDPVFKNPPPNIKSKMHLLPPSKERASLRSATPKNFATWVWMANV